MKRIDLYIKVEVDLPSDENPQKIAEESAGCCARCTRFVKPNCRTWLSMTPTTEPPAETPAQPKSPLAVLRQNESVMPAM